MKEPRYFVDTNIFLRVFVDEGNSVSKDCLDFLKKIKEGKIKAKTSDLVLSEINWVLGSHYGFAKKDVIEAIKSIIFLKNLKIENNANIKEAISLYEKYNVKFIDTLLAAGCEDCFIVSYDKDFDKIGIKRVEPKDLIK